MASKRASTISSTIAEAHGRVQKPKNTQNLVKTRRAGRDVHESVAAAAPEPRYKPHLHVRSGGCQGCANFCTDTSRWRI